MMPWPQAASRSAKGFCATASSADFPAVFSFSTRPRVMTSMSRNFARFALLPSGPCPATIWVSLSARDRIVPTAAIMPSQLEQAIRSARLAAGGKLGLLRIGFVSTAGIEIVPDIVRQFKKSNPDVEFSLRNIFTANQAQMLESGSLHGRVLRIPVGEHAALDVVTVHREPFVLVVPSSHKLAK